MHTKETLCGYLAGRNVPWQTWGAGKAKTVEHLLKELNDGECALMEDGEATIRHAAGAMRQALGRVRGKRAPACDYSQFKAALHAFFASSVGA